MQYHPVIKIQKESHMHAATTALAGESHQILTPEVLVLVLTMPTVSWGGLTSL